MSATTPKKKAKKGPKRPRTMPPHPRVSVMVDEAVTFLKQQGRTPSLQTIRKHIRAHHKVDMDRLSPFIKEYWESAAGALVQTGSYPVHLTDVMDIGQSSQSGLLRGVQPNTETRTLTVREYEQRISELTKENFDLKLRIYLFNDFIEKYRLKDGTIPDIIKSVDVIIELQVETEDLRNSLNSKTKSLEDALEQIEKLQQEYSRLQEQLGAAVEQPSKEQLEVLQDENSVLQEEIENLQASLTTKNQELEEAACQIEELSSKNKYLEEKVKKSSIAIRGFISKHAKELELFPQAVRPIIQTAVESAKNNDYCNLDLAIKSFKSSLCEMMTVPIKAFMSDSEDKENKDVNSGVMCLNEENLMFGRTTKHVERHRSDPSVQLNNLQVRKKK